MSYTVNAKFASTCSDPSESNCYTCFIDDDLDNFGSNLIYGYFLDNCPIGASLYSTDCDDNNSSIHPGATEICSDSIDNDCDGAIDGDDSDCGGTSGGTLCAGNETGCVECFTDFDGDFVGGRFSVWMQGDCFDGKISLSGDCNDHNNSIYPGATEVCYDGVDNDCDGLIDESDSDCIEVCNNADDDDDHLVDENTGYCIESPGCYRNTKTCQSYSPNTCPTGDCFVQCNPGHNDPVCTSWSCDSQGGPPGYVCAHLTCDKFNFVCDGSTSAGTCLIDGNPVNRDYNDCAIAPQEVEIHSSLKWVDDGSFGCFSCGESCTGSISNDYCDPFSKIFSCNAEEFCEWRSGDECNTRTNRLACSIQPPVCNWQCGTTTCYYDSDGDSLGDPLISLGPMIDCPVGYVDNNLDCDDSDPNLPKKYYKDDDGDGYGNESQGTTLSCNTPAGYSLYNNDCDPFDSCQHPNQVWYLDADNDSYISDGTNGQAVISQCFNPSCASTSCSSHPHIDYFSNATECVGSPNQAQYYRSNLIFTDCNDSDPNAYVSVTVYPDYDNDGFYDCDNPVNFCTDGSAPAGYSKTCSLDDCDDNNDFLTLLCCNDSSSYEFVKSGSTMTYDSNKPYTILFKIRNDNGDLATGQYFDNYDYPFDNGNMGLPVYSSTIKHSYTNPNNKTFYDKSIYACSSTPNASVYYDDLFMTVNLVTDQTFHKINLGFGDDYVTRANSSYACDDTGCPWLDCDNDVYSATNCGVLYLENGYVLPSGWVNFNENHFSPFGEYTQNNMRKEACGDDSGEEVSVGICEASITHDALCCPNTDMYVLDGACVLKSECPDVMEGVPVWLEMNSSTVSNETLDTIEAGLVAQGLGYCCNHDLGTPGKDLCQASDFGCYKKESIKNVFVDSNNLTKPGYFSNQNNCDPTDSCAVSLCSADGPLSFCEMSTVCDANYQGLDVFSMTENYECNISSTTNTKVACYPPLDDEGACNTSTCEKVTENVCTLVDDSSCSAVCMRDESNNIIDGSCKLVCDESAYDCQDKTTYRNCQDMPNCAYDNTETSMVCSSKIDFVVDKSSCKSTTVTACNDFGCGPQDYCGVPDGSLDYFDNCENNLPEFFTTSLYCEDKNICTKMPCDENQPLNSTDNLKCVPQNTSALNINRQPHQFIVMNSKNDSLACSIKPVGFKGQPMCPVEASGEAFVYKEAENRCQREQDTCALGIIGQPDTYDNPCYNLTDGTDYWNLYTNSCFKGTEVGLYQRACCPMIEIQAGDQTFTLYKDNSELNTIRVY